jgi:hypothetical protein
MKGLLSQRATHKAPIARKAEIEIEKYPQTCDMGWKETEKIQEGD